MSYRVELISCGALFGGDPDRGALGVLRVSLKKDPRATSRSVWQVGPFDELVGLTVDDLIVARETAC